MKSQVSNCALKLDAMSAPSEEASDSGLYPLWQQTLTEGQARDESPYNTTLDRLVNMRRTSKARRETQTLFLQANKELDDQGFTRAAKLRHDTQTVLRLANRELENKEQVAAGAVKAAELAVNAATVAADLAQKAAKAAAEVAAKEAQRREADKMSRAAKALAADVLPLLLIIDPEGAMDATKYAARYAQNGLRTECVIHSLLGSSHRPLPQPLPCSLLERQCQH